MRQKTAAGLDSNRSSRSNTPLGSALDRNDLATAATSAVRNAVPNGQVAQSVEQGTENPRVGGSIPSLATIKLRLTPA